MTANQIKEILKGNFADAEDREYWEKRLKETERKEKSAKENEKYLLKMKVYDRL